jgi:hypothetical protein
MAASAQNLAALHPVMQSAIVKNNPVSRKDVKSVVASLRGSSSGSTTCKQLRLGPTQPQLKHRQLSCNHFFLRTPARNLKSSSFPVKLSRGTGSRKGWSSRGTARPNVPHASMDDFDFSAGPIDDVRPTFTRDAYEIPPPDPPKVFDNPPRKRNGRPKVTPPQASIFRCFRFLPFTQLQLRSSLSLTSCRFQVSESMRSCD